jgi:ferredoxin-like protein FixX
MKNKLTQQPIKIDISKLPDLECWEIKSADSPLFVSDTDRCHSKVFVKTYQYKKISAIVSPTGNEETIAIEYVKCLECGVVKVLNG